MAVGTAAPEEMMGGTFSQGPTKGVYHGVVNDAANKETTTGGKRLELVIFGKADPAHPEKEGKKLFNVSQTYPKSTDDKDKQDQMRGIWKRIVFDGFGLSWSKDAKVFDPRQLIGKEAWFLVDERKGGDGQMRNDVVAIAQDKDKLPQRTNRANGTVTEPAKSGRRR